VAFGLLAQALLGLGWLLWTPGCAGIRDSIRSSSWSVVIRLALDSGLNAEVGVVAV
jgi:hypothetical protein